ncbi:discoidin domain-containing protein, partial [Paenibacillus sp.]|uniref:GH85 family endohexosaminidase C-terminal domain-containing protein n=1 Tax=Paenibacillus sp. TaxID=58172 RepID=UPI003464E7E6
VGPNSDPRNTATSSNWKGIANYFADKSSIQQLPFTTNFNTGHGSQFAVDGNIMSTKEWNNRSLQDILPTWRWIAESSGTALKPSFDWNNAYYGGSSLKVSGALSPQNATHLKLYRTSLPVSSDTEVSVTYKTGESASNMKVGVSFADNPEHFEFFDVGDGEASAWNTKSISLGSFAGRTIDALSLKFDSGNALSNYAINIGQLSVRNAGSSSVPETVTGLAIEDVDFSGNTADARLSWNPSSGDKIQAYEVYRVKPDGTREFIGATPNTAYYAQPMSRLGGEESTTLEVVALGENGARSTAAQASFQWKQASSKMNLALNQTATADSFVPGETPAKAFDGTTANNSKWCATGSEPHWLQVDLGSVYSIDQFIIKHAQEGGESSSFNTKEFNIQLSEDGTNWTDVVQVTGNTMGKTTHSIDPMSARYARLNVTKATQESDTAARIYEFEVWGQQLQ